MAQEVEAPMQKGTLARAQREDEKAQRAVLALVLFEHPDHRTIPDLARELNAAEDFNDAVERAIRDLVGVGLLRCERGRVLPTEAALHFDRLAL